MKTGLSAVIYKKAFHLHYLNATVSDSTRFLFALLALDGVGQVTARRLLRHFSSLEDVRRYPHEQVLTRLKGVPKAANLVANLFDDTVMTPALAEADRTLLELARRRLEVLTSRHEAWPAAFEMLPNSYQPAYLQTYGRLDAFARPRVAFFATPPLQPDHFERSEALQRHLKALRIAPVTAGLSGFDVVVQKIATTGATRVPVMVVLAAGMAHLPPPLRPMASQSVRSGGILISPFALQHGPFDYDDKTRAHVMAALADACVFIEPKPKTPNALAMQWAHEVGRPVFGMPASDAPLPDYVHPIASEIDFEWVARAVLGEDH